ncbi:hypothetical protein FRC12_011686 [Ceratobasidium sp. 428]|nr:hypothetical protein FRC12_011686 [Ceratobasidium sp. 428]
MRNRDILLEVAVKRPTCTTCGSLSEETGAPAGAAGSNRRRVYLPAASNARQGDLHPSDNVLNIPKIVGVASDMLEVPIVAEDSSSQAIHGPVEDNVSPEMNGASSQRHTLEAGVQPVADAFTQSSPTATDIPPLPLKPSPPSKPVLSTLFVTITNAPVTRTILDTTTLTRTITLPVPPPPSPTPTTKTPPPESVWNPPVDFANLDCFGILKYGFGKSNLKVVHGIPLSASASASTPAPSSTLKWTNEMSAIEAFYPEGSINPGNSPQGGADFYANPLPALKDAQNVTFGYSVFLPVDFEPVRGGKLPGLYGGKTGCSGGDAALDCFSTRLMWRAKNDGELYLVSCLLAPSQLILTSVRSMPPKINKPTACATLHRDPSAKRTMDSPSVEALSSLRLASGPM